MDEFSLIKRFFDDPHRQMTKHNQSLVQGIGDDCAVLSVPDGHDLVFSLDTLVESVHFPVGANAGDIAWRLLGASVSDLAAMGAQANNFTLALTLPQLTEAWLQDFSENLALAAACYGITLAGGDTTKGPLALSAQVQGFVPKGMAMLRSGASVGDFICVSGTLGDSRAGLTLIDSEIVDEDQRYLLERYYRPTPRLEVGQLVREHASACIDISDGLLADLNHILSRSNVAAKINSQSVPISDALLRYAPEHALQWALTGGEDFELCFTVPAERWSTLQYELQAQDVPVSAIGVIAESSGIEIFQDGHWESIAADGFNHFSTYKKETRD